MSNYEKDSKEYATKVSAARQLKDFVSAAQPGNKAAPGLIPMSEVRTLVNRVIREELEAVSSGAGSAWDRLQGKIGSLTEGQPIPPEVLKDINTITGVMENVARRNYEYNVKITNQTYGSKAQPIDLPQTSADTKTGGMIRARDPQGKLHEAPAGTELPTGWTLETK
ncbi:MAG: hypothetical protein JWO19_5721 [Bryobacterales bacterium]|jgi:hypothetical protein|nr:hypothetical protein [Bryobacterales bacterium]